MSSEADLSIWGDDSQSLAPFENVFTAVLFHLSPVATSQENLQAHQNIYDDLQRRLRPWIEHYIWDEEPISISQHEHGGYNYIQLSLKLGDTDTDEWLVTSILWDMSAVYEDLFIRCWDSEGDHILIEAWKYLPEWIQPEVANNRAWINHQRVIFVPEVYYKYRGLKLEESLTFLMRASYKCLRVLEIESSVKARCDEFPKKALEEQMPLDLIVSRKVAGVLMKDHNCLNHSVIRDLKERSVVLSTGQGTDYTVRINDPVLITVRARVECFLMLDLWIKQNQGSVDFKKDAGFIVTNAIERYSKGIGSDEFVPLDNEINEFSGRGDLLQKELIQLMRIDGPVPPKLDFDPPDLRTLNTHLDENDMMSKLEKFFKDNESGIDGVENIEEPKHKVKHNIQEVERKSTESDDSETDGDYTAREFLKSQNIDIDEDDFFEFFAKEALKLSQDDIAKFRNMKIEDPIEQQANSDDELADDEELGRQLDEEGLHESLQELIRSLRSGIDGPAATLLHNMK